MKIRFIGRYLRCSDYEVDGVRYSVYDVEIPYDAVQGVIRESYIEQYRSFAGKILGPFYDEAPQDIQRALLDWRTKHGHC